LIGKTVATKNITPSTIIETSSGLIEYLPFGNPDLDAVLSAPARL
jgi:hypothetical protein